MGNPISQLLDQVSNQSQQTPTQQSITTERVNNIKNTLNMLENSNNPQALFQLLVNTNPQLKQVMEYVQQNGGDPRTAFYRLANQMGKDPNEVLRKLK